MSRGPGKWQRLILEAVSQGDELRLLDLMPPVPHKLMTGAEFLSDCLSKQQAIERAARQLERRGLIVRGRVRSPGSRPYRQKWDTTAKPGKCLSPSKDT